VRRANSHSHQDSSAVYSFPVPATILAEDLRFRGRGILTTVGAPALHLALIHRSSWMKLRNTPFVF
jgi:hypothetical protein